MAAVITSVVVPLVRSLGLHLGLTDQPDIRKQHSTPMVRLGGVAMVMGFCFSLAITWGLGGFGLVAPAKDQLICANDTFPYATLAATDCDNVNL